MKQNLFFKTTQMYREYKILDIIEKEKKTTQREISDNLNVSVSLINKYIEDYEKKKLLKRNYLSSKTINYIITKKGLERKKLLNIWYLKSSIHIYESAKLNIISFLKNISRKGYKNILLYAAGEVAEIILDVIENDKSTHLNVMAVIDDDIKKENNTIKNKSIINVENISEFRHDGILISSYTNRKKIYNNLLRKNYDAKKIIQFF